MTTLQRSRSNLALVRVALGAVAVLLFEPAALAQCVAASNGPHINTDQRKPFQVNVDSAATITGLDGSGSAVNWTAAQLANGASAAAALVNEQANAGWYEYTGSTSNTLATVQSFTEAQCITNGVQSIVHFTDNCKGSLGQAFAICGGTRFVIEVSMRGPAPACANTRTLNNGTITSGAQDLVTVLAHELIHALNIGHPAAGVSATVGPTGARGRQLYQYDLECTAGTAGSLSGFREQEATRRDVTSSGATVTIGSRYAVKSAVAKVAAGWTDVTGGWAWLSAYQGSSAGEWDLNANGTTVAMPLVDETAGVGLVPGAFREVAGYEHVLFSSPVDDTGQTDPNSRHQLMATYSTNNFSGSILTAMRQCTTMTGPMQCSSPNRTDIFTSGRVAVGYLADIGRTVLAWSSQDRSSTNASANSELVKVAVGSVDSSAGLIVPVPTSMGRRTSVPPALACYEDGIDGYDCILFYVPAEDDAYQLSSRRFSVTWNAGSNRYTLTWEPNPRQVPAYTGNPVAAWYMTSSSRVYVAYRDLGVGNPLKAISSADGITWTVVGSTLGDIISGPSAASMWRGDSNILMYVR